MRLCSESSPRAFFFSLIQFSKNRCSILTNHFSCILFVSRLTCNVARTHTPTSVHTTLRKHTCAFILFVVSISPDSSASEKICNGCRRPIEDPFHFSVSPDTEWHVSCLQCFKCNSTLDESGTCFMKEGRPYCRRDYVL